MTPPIRRGRGKQVTPQAITGQQGINIIEAVVLEMGCAWHPGNASLDAGIDGEIELVDPATREATNLVIRVQGKATTRPFIAETSDDFEWPVDERDLDYWLSGNAPVILVVTRPATREAYWVPLRSYFSTPDKRKTQRVRFDKKTMRFTAQSHAALVALALPRESGIYLGPPPRDETIYSNLLEVTEYPPALWIGETSARTPKDVFDTLDAAGVATPEFVLRDSRLLAPYDLTKRPWSQLVDGGTVEQIETEHWAGSTDPELRGRFVELLNYCLNALCAQIGCERRRDGHDVLHYFTASPDLQPRYVPYKSVKEATRRAVFKPYYYTRGERRGEISHYRHSAFIGDFKRYDGRWYLTITPTYVFTTDGHQPDPFYEAKLKGIKLLERNATVLGQVAMWAALLHGPDENEWDFFPRLPYPHLRFGGIARFTLQVGLNDETWLPNEDARTAESVTNSAEHLPLFGLPGTR